MAFLQPMLLAALPIVALPIVIHLINQRRYQTIRWGAMMFLLAANRMSRGYARLRQWWILLFRMLAIAGLIFAISRPLASGQLGMAVGSATDTTIVLMDASPSMRQQGSGADSKLETGRQQLVRTLKTLSSSRWVLIESTSPRPRELETPDDLRSLTPANGTSASADVPAMLLAARDYIQSNKTGRTEIWLCSDVRQNDWNPDDVRWQAVRDSLLGFSQGIRLHLLAYPRAAPDNLAVRVSDVRRQTTREGAELLVSLQIEREASENSKVGDVEQSEARTTVPVQFEIEGARSELTVEMTGPRFDLQDHRIPLDNNQQRGWGKVSIPADANPGDNDFYFLFDEPVARHTVLVAEDAQAVRPWELAASISPDPALQCSTVVLSPEQLPSVEWEKASLVIWQAPLPVGDAADRVQAFIHRGGCVMFVAPRNPTPDGFAGVHWTSWTHSPENVAIQSWRGDQDLLARTQSGAALPIGQLAIHRYCGLAGDHTPLAVLAGGASLLGRVPTDRGAVYFCATTATNGDSSLASDAVALYVLVQRAIGNGAASLGNSRQLVAGNVARSPGVQLQDWRRLAGAEEALSTDFAYHAGIYGAEEKMFAVNRAEEEDLAPVLPDARVAALFEGLDFARVDDQAGSLASLLNEIWRPFLVAMIGALLAESALCLPRVSPKPTAPGGMPT